MGGAEAGRANNLTIEIRVAPLERINPNQPSSGGSTVELAHSRKHSAAGINRRDLQRDYEKMRGCDNNAWLPYGETRKGDRAAAHKSERRRHP